MMHGQYITSFLLAMSYKEAVTTHCLKFLCCLLACEVTVVTRMICPQNFGRICNLLDFFRLA